MGRKRGRPVIKLSIVIVGPESNTPQGAAAEDSVSPFLTGYCSRKADDTDCNYEELTSTPEHIATCMVGSSRPVTDFDASSVLIPG